MSCWQCFLPWQTPYKSPPHLLPSPSCFVFIWDTSTICKPFKSQQGSPVKPKIIFRFTDRGRAFSSSGDGLRTPAFSHVFGPWDQGLWWTAGPLLLLPPMLRVKTPGSPLVQPTTTSNSVKLPSVHGEVCKLLLGHSAVSQIEKSYRKCGEKSL